MEHKNANEKEKTSPKKVFFPKARALSNEEVDTLSAEEKAFAKECQDRGVWLEIFCPDDNCLLEGERMQLPIFCKDSKNRQDLWLEIFCPDNSCELSVATQLP
jgi:muconolactone delta-isomerase